MINLTHFRYFRLITIILIRELAKVLLNLEPLAKLFHEQSVKKVYYHFLRSKK
jgi:hypothetical protein